MKKIRFGLIGYGAWGSHHARAIAESPRAELAAIVSRTAANQEAAHAAHPQATIMADWRELLARPDIDAVDVVLPTDLHHSVGRAVLEAGKHLLLEKPMAPTVEQCEDLIALASAKGRLLAIGHEFRLSSLWGRVKEMIDSGAIGEPKYALIELWRNPYRLGASGWRYDISRVGNWILEEPIHFFDLARWYFAKAGAPVSVYARANSRRPDHPELQDNFSAILNFGTGSYAVISQTLGAYEHHQVVKITGAKGSLWANWSGALDRTFHPTFSLNYHDGEVVRPVTITKMTGEVYELVEEINAFAAAIQDGSPIPATGEDGKWSVAMCLKAQQSVETGGPVLFDHAQ